MPCDDLQGSGGRTLSVAPMEALSGLSFQEIFGTGAHRHRRRHRHRYRRRRRCRRRHRRRRTRARTLMHARARMHAHRCTTCACASSPEPQETLPSRRGCKLRPLNSDPSRRLEPRTQAKVQTKACLVTCDILTRCCFSCRVWAFVRVLASRPKKSFYSL